MLTKTKTNFEIKATPNFFYNEKAELMIYDAKDGSTMKYEKKRLRMLLRTLYDDGSETEEIIEHAVFNFTVAEEVFPVIMSLEDAVKLSAFIRKYLNYLTRQLDQTRYFLITNAPFFKENYLRKTDEEATPIQLDKIKELFGVNVKIEYKQYDNINREFIKRISMEVPDINMIPAVEFQKGIRNFLHEQFYHEHKELISQKVQLEASPPPVAGENTLDKPNNNLNKPNKPTTEQLSDLITHDKRVEIVARIETQYRTIQGKRLKLLLLALQDLKLIQRERIASKFHNCCKKEFDWDIASYNAMNGYNYNERTDSVELDEMKGFIQALTKQ